MRVCQFMLCGLVGQNLVDKGVYLPWALDLLKRCLWSYSPSPGLPVDPATFVLNTSLLTGEMKILDADLGFFPCSPDRKGFLIELFDFVKKLWAFYTLEKSELEDSLLGVSIVLAYNLRLYQANDRIVELIQLMKGWCKSQNIPLIKAKELIEMKERALSQSS